MLNDQTTDSESSVVKRQLTPEPGIDEVDEKPPGFFTRAKQKQAAQRKKIREKLRHEKPPFGKDGPGGHWFVRIPIWLQSTILIFSIGFLSILILTLVSAIQVWSYTEKLMQNRLSSLAGMTAIEFEQSFNSLEKTASTPYLENLIDLLNVINGNRSALPYWSTFNRDLAVQMSFSDCLALEVYDVYLRSVYSYRKRTSSSEIFGEQSDMIPISLFPLSVPDLRDNMLANLNKTKTAILANATVNQVKEDSRQANITYSISLGLTADSEWSDFDSLRNRFSKGNSRKDTNLPWIGFVTFVLRNPVASAVVNEQQFPQYVIEVVRLNDILLKNTLEQSYNEGEFSFLYPFVTEDGYIDYHRRWNISSFPVLLDAIGLVNESARLDDSALNKTEQSRLENNLGDPDNHKTFDYSENVFKRASNKVSIINKQELRVNSSRIQRSNNSGDSNSTSSTNNGLGNSTSAVNTTSNDTSAIKTDSALMRTTSPFNKKSSVGYSFANIYNQKWLVFIQIPESEAFHDAISLRNVLIGVGCGILGAVLLILLPLSRWQTKGFYVIYQNMKLRPLFTSDEPLETDAEEAGRTYSEPLDTTTPSESLDQKDLVVSTTRRKERDQTGDPVGDRTDIHAGVQIGSHTGGSQGGGDPDAGVGADAAVAAGGVASAANRTSSSPNSKRGNAASRELNEVSRTPTHISNLSAAHTRDESHGENSYHLNIPKPLPPLKRWYRDEVDNLIEAYNSMTEKLNAHYLHLDDQVRLRTREVQKARELREQANVAKSEFIAIISHELRTPLNGVMGLTAVSVDEPDINNIRKSLRIIIESGHTLMDLLNELLELSKSLVGVDPVVYEFTPDSLLETLPNIFASRAPAASVSFGLTCVPNNIGSLRLRGDVDHVTQVCLNFMSNAMKFSETNGFVSVILHIRPLNDPLINLRPYGSKLPNANAILELLVTDSGVGISPTQLARIFDLFVQGEDPLRKNRKGAGLGMALSKQLAEGIGGYVTVFSAKDVGTTTIIRVPVEVIDHTEAEIQALNGPPIEFKVKDVYSAVSLQSGVVTKVQRPPRAITSTGGSGGTGGAGGSVQRTDSSHARNSSSLTGNFSSLPRRSRHSHHSSGGSRALLNRSHQVSKLFRAHSIHKHNRSEFSNGSRESDSTEATSADLFQNVGGDGRSSSQTRSPAGSIVTSPIPAIGGSRANNSNVSLLLNVPEGLVESTKPMRSSSPSCNSMVVDDNSNTTSLLNFEDKQSKASSLNPTGSHRSGAKHRPERLQITSNPHADTAEAAAVSTGTPPPESVHALHQPPASLLDNEPLSASSDPQRVLHFSSASEYTPSPTSEIDPEVKVLVAEDNKLNQDIMIRMLRQMNVHNVDTADDGLSVIKLIEKSIVNGYHYNLIFMDLSMPGINGIDATQIIRTTLGYPYPIVALTGFSDLQTRNACLAVNIQEVLTKPVMKFDILRVLQKYTSMHTSPPTTS